jgi:hypothetical protein
MNARLGPPPVYDVRFELSHRIEMRDGIRLSTDLHFPVGAAWPLPAVLLRTPYDKRHWLDDAILAPRARLFASQGYVVAVQDVRGRFESEGEFLVGRGDIDDGCDTIDWLIRQAWSNGRVGTYGCSYMAELQVYLAKRGHPALRAMIICAGGGATGSLGGRYTRFGAKSGGAFCLASMVAWMLQGSKIFARLPASLADEEFRRLAPLYSPGPRLATAPTDELFRHLPVEDILRHASAPPSDYEALLTREPDDPWWNQFDYLAGGDDVDGPAIHVDSWYDPCVSETLERFEHFRAHARSDTARRNQFAVIGPGLHCQSEYATERTLVGARDVGDARADLWAFYVRWFDYWLKGEDNGVTTAPVLRYYVMGRNQWRTADAWPVHGTRFVPFYLHSGGRANSRHGDGTLSEQAPADEPPDAFIYDPATPVPTVGGPGFPTLTPGLAAGALDQREVEERQDVLVYTSAPLPEGLEVTGPIRAVLFVSSSVPDTDITCKLVDVYPDGRAFNIQEGILRMRYRGGVTTRAAMRPGEVYRVEVDLQATSNFFGPGHRIRLEVSSSNFPRFDRNLNTGGRNWDESEGVLAHNRVHHAVSSASHLLLPLL